MRKVGTYALPVMIITVMRDRISAGITNDNSSKSPVKFWLTGRFINAMENGILGVDLYPFMLLLVKSLQAQIVAFSFQESCLEWLYVLLAEWYILVKELLLKCFIGCAYDHFFATADNWYEVT